MVLPNPFKKGKYQIALSVIATSSQANYLQELCILDVGDAACIQEHNYHGKEKGCDWGSITKLFA